MTLSLFLWPVIWVFVVALQGEGCGGAASDPVRGRAVAAVRVGARAGQGQCEAVHAARRYGAVALQTATADDKEGACDC